MSNPTPEPRTEHQDDPWKELLEEWCGQPWKPVATSGANVHWCPHCGASRYTHDVGVARAAVDARHAEEIAAKDREIADLKRKRVTKRELREYQDIEGDALTLRSYIKEQGETPMMTASLLKKATVELTTLREQLAAAQQERDDKAAMHSELATLAGSAIVLATLDTLAGERPTQEPEHALPAAVWRLVQERDEARAANTANLREMVGMAGRFRQTLQTVRACIVALTPGHRTGYDWNADPLYLTRKEGEALSAIDAALSSPSTQEPPRCTACGACEPFLKDGETPAECIARNRADTQAVMSLLAAAKLQLEVQTESPRQATCETHGHIYGHEGVCIFCRTPKPTQEPQTVCEWRETHDGPWETSCGRWWELMNGGPEDNDITYCHGCAKPVQPLKLSPESPNEGAK